MTCRVTQQALAEYRAFAQTGRVVVFDTETTGLCSEDEIVQFAALEYQAGELSREFMCYVCPTCAINPGAEAVHHLSRQFLGEHGLAPTEAISQFLSFLGEDALVVAHNLRFDWRMLKGECNRFSSQLPAATLKGCDTIALAKKLMPGLAHYRLSFLIEALGLTGENSHDALEDARACGKLFFHLVEQIPSPGEWIREPECN